ncbi:MAG: TetR/AcrR family transcriptional regulator [Phycisphaerae bacterium]|nr:TetR/AcrR family transcriptional regulator [Phycisphaerae bacterium]
MARPIEKREHIERGVVEVIARKGLRGTTIQNIADAASVSPGLLYRYWKNRDELAADVYRKQYIALVGRLANVAATELDAVAQLRAVVRAFLRFADEQPVLLRFLLLSQHDLARNVPEEFGVRGLARQIVEHGMAQGKLRQMEPGLAIQLLLGIVLQPAIGAVYGHLSTPVSKHFDAVFDALQRVLIAGAKGGLSDEH